MKASTLALACGLALAVVAGPVAAQHAGHHPPGHTAPMPVKKAAPARKPVAKAPAAKKQVAKKPAGQASAAKKAVAKRSASKASKPTAKPTARDHAAMGHGAHGAGMDHAAMGHAPAPADAAHDHDSMRQGTHGAHTGHAPAGASAPAGGAHGHAPAKAGVEGSTADPAGMDHAAHHAHMDPAAMGHGGQPANADHAAMGHGTPAGNAAAHEHAPMQHGAQGAHAGQAAMDHAAMGHALPDLPADAAPRTPIPVISDADRAAAFPDASGHAAHDAAIHSVWLADRLEWQDTDAGTLAWEGLAWIGGDVHRAWLRTEGEAEDGAVDHANVEVLYGRAVTAWWDVVAGVRHDFGEGPSRTWAALGVQGLAPYKFEVEATAYVGDGGRTAASLEAEYDTLITNRLVLQWVGEATLNGRDDPARGIGSGLSTVEAGARLRYEVTRRFAPYVGVEWERAFGETADLRRDEGHAVEDTRLVAGIRFWF